MNLLHVHVINSINSIAFYVPADHFLYNLYVLLDTSVYVYTHLYDT